VFGAGDEIIVTENDFNKIIIEKITGDENKLPLEAIENTCTVAMQAMLDELKIKTGFNVIINKQMPLGSGMGSSAASAVGGVFALNELLNNPFTKTELIKFAPALWALVIFLLIMIKILEIFQIQILFYIRKFYQTFQN
jgi:homoserine kinase